MRETSRLTIRRRPALLQATASFAGEACLGA